MTPSISVVRTRDDPVLSVRDLVVEFDTRFGVVQAVNGVSFDVYPGETLGVVGESGSGKSVSLMAVLDLLSKPTGKIIQGEVRFRGKDLRAASTREMKGIRGRDIAMVFQDPMTSLNPVMTIGSQIVEALRSKDPHLSRVDARIRVAELLQLVGVPDPERRADQYPHQFSGGMRQRAMIAMAIANEPAILIADEPTTALDVTIQAQVMEVLRKAQVVTNSAMVLITHDLGLIAECAQRVIVMYAGRVAEVGYTDDIFTDPKHPYTLGLLTSLPRIDVRLQRLPAIPGAPPDAINPPSGCPFHPRCQLGKDRAVCRDVIPQLTAGTHAVACHFTHEVPQLRRRVAAMAHNGAARTPPPRARRGFDRTAQPHQVVGPAPLGQQLGQQDANLLTVIDLKVHFPIRSGVLGRPTGSIRAVDGVSIALDAGETLGLVGESGSGKSSTGKAIMRLLDATAGHIVFRGRDITALSRRHLRDTRRHIQMVFQDPFSSLDPRMTVNQLVSEPLRIHRQNGGRRSRHRAAELLEMVGLDAQHGERYPHEFSGGQRQRIGIARALALSPDVLILDEPVSSLDVSVQAQIIELLMDLQKDLGLAFMFIAHDLAVVQHISHRVAVMYLGKIVEIGDRHQIYDQPTHPYTQALLSAVPIPDPNARERPDKIILKGDIPNPANPPSGCRFRTRCWKAREICATQEPELVDRLGHGHPSACHFPEVAVPPVGSRAGVSSLIEPVRTLEPPE